MASAPACTSLQLPKSFFDSTSGIAYEADVQERACFTSCLGLAFGRVRRSCIGGRRVSHLPRRRVSLRMTQHELDCRFRIRSRPHWSRMLQSRRSQCSLARVARWLFGHIGPSVYRKVQQGYDERLVQLDSTAEASERSERIDQVARLGVSDARHEGSLFHFSCDQHSPGGLPSAEKPIENTTERWKVGTLSPDSHNVMSILRSGDPTRPMLLLAAISISPSTRRLIGIESRIFGLPLLPCLPMESPHSPAFPPLHLTAIPFSDHIPNIWNDTTSFHLIVFLFVLRISRGCVLYLYPLLV